MEKFFIAYYYSLPKELFKYFIIIFWKTLEVRYERIYKKNMRCITDVILLYFSQQDKNRLKIEIKTCFTPPNPKVKMENLDPLKIEKCIFKKENEESMVFYST